jgi:hypothetical protein
LRNGILFGPESESCDTCGTCGNYDLLSLAVLAVLAVLAEVTKVTKVTQVKKVTKVTDQPFFTKVAYFYLIDKGLLTIVKESINITILTHSV